MLTTGRKDPMSVVEIDRATGALVVKGQKVFPLVLSDGPPLGAKTPAGEDALAVLVAGGANFLRVGRHEWSAGSIDQEIAGVREVLDAAAAHGLHCWLQLGNTPDLPARGLAAREQLLTQIAGQLRTIRRSAPGRGSMSPRTPAGPPGCRWPGSCVPTGSCGRSIPTTRS